MLFKRIPKIETVTFSIVQSYKIQSKSIRANLQIGSKENMFVNVLEIFKCFRANQFISNCKIDYFNIKINGMTKSAKNKVDSVFLTDSYNHMMIIVKLSKYNYRWCSSTYSYIYIEFDGSVQNNSIKRWHYAQSLKLYFSR